MGDLWGRNSRHRTTLTADIPNILTDHLITVVAGTVPGQTTSSTARRIIQKATALPPIMRRGGRRLGLRIRGGSGHNTPTLGLHRGRLPMVDRMVAMGMHRRSSMVQQPHNMMAILKHHLKGPRLDMQIRQLARQAEVAE